MRTHGDTIAPPLHAVATDLHKMRAGKHNENVESDGWLEESGEMEN